MKNPIKPFGFILKHRHDYHLNQSRADHLLFSSLEVFQPHKGVSNTEAMVPLYTKEDVDTILKEAIRRIEMLRLCWGDPAEESGMSRTIDILNDMSKENESSIIIEDEQ
jgi:hypothetical protein